MFKHFPRILVHAICASLLEFLLPVAARQQSDGKRTRSLGGKQIPDAIANYDGVVNRYAKALRCCEKQIRVRFA